MSRNISKLINENSEYFISILHHEIILSMILFIVILGISFLLRKRSPYWQYGLWSLVLIRLILPPDLHFSYSAYNLYKKVNFDFNISDVSNFALFQDEENGNEKESNSSPFRLIFATEYRNTIEERTYDWLTISVIFWCAGMLATLLIFVKRLIGYWRLIANATLAENAALQKIIHVWQKQFRINRKVQLNSSDEYLSPFTIGVLRPMIFLPKGLIVSAEIGTLQAIIAHEMAHIKRFDDLWIKLQNVVQIIYFFHPVVWYANSQINLARERLCDRMVLSTQAITPESYGQSMFTVLNMKMFGVAGAQLTPGFGNQKKKLRHRFQEIIGGNVMKKQNQKFVLSVVILLGIFLLPMADTKIETDTRAIAAAGSKLIEDKIQEKQNLELSPPIKSGHITSTFGPYIDPFTNKEAPHVGIDIGAKVGTKVFAPAPGLVEKVVTDINEHPGFGMYLTIDHGNGYKTLYAHLSKVLVKKGQKVDRWTPIGLVGNTGKSTGPHLHYELIIRGKNVNPQKHSILKSLKKDI